MLLERTLVSAKPESEEVGCQKSKNNIVDPLCIFQTRTCIMAPVPTTSQEAFPAIRTSLQSMTQADASSQPPSALFEPSPLRGRQRVSSSVSLLEEPHASLISPARRRAGMNVMIPMGGLGSRFKSGILSIVRFLLKWMRAELAPDRWVPPP